MHLSKILQLMFAPADTSLENGGELSVNDMIDELASDVVEEPSKEEDLLTEPKPEDTKEKEEEKIELEDEDEPEVDDLQPIEVVSRKEILKKYPEIFKDFPQLETSYYREKKYAEVFPTIEDAKEASEKVQTYDRFENQVLNGNLDEIIAGVKSADQKAYNKMVDNYLPMLGKVDQQAYFHIIGNVIKNTVVGMVNEAKASENEDLQAAAVILHQFMFGKSEFKKAEPYGPHKPDEKENELTREKQEFAKQKFEGVLENLATTNTNIIKSTISQHMDPKGVMSDYVKKTAIKEAIAEVEETMNSNTRFKSVMDKLWEQAIKTNYSSQSLANIKKAHLNQAKTILRPIILKHKNAALKGMGKRVTEEREEPTKKGPVSVGRTAAANNSSKETVPKGMRTLDYLMQD
jgi:hypothetical protein